MTANPSIDALLGDIVNMAHNAAEGRASPQSLLRYINKRIDEYRAETATLAPAAPVEERDLLWSLPANLRWLAEHQIFNGYTPSGTLPGVLLKLAADRIEQLASATLDKPQGVGDNG